MMLHMQDGKCDEEAVTSVCVNRQCHFVSHLCETVVALFLAYFSFYIISSSWFYTGISDKVWSG